MAEKQTLDRKSRGAEELGGAMVRVQLQTTVESGHLPSIRWLSTQCGQLWAKLLGTTASLQNFIASAMTDEDITTSDHLRAPHRHKGAYPWAAPPFNSALNSGLF